MWTKLSLPRFGKGRFRIQVKSKDKKVWRLSIKDEYFINAEKDDGVWGVEKQEGEIKIPLEKIDTINIVLPQKVRKGGGTSANIYEDE